LTVIDDPTAAARSIARKIIATIFFVAAIGIETRQKEMFFTPVRELAMFGGDIRAEGKIILKRVSCFPEACCNRSLFGGDVKVANILFQT
jgi:hypothetical protein